jgi:hypothetical protein
VTRGYGGAIAQLKRVTDDINAGAPGLEILKGREVLQLIVLLDPVYGANNPLWEPFRQQAKIERGVPKEFEAQICSVHALERLAPGLAQIPLSQVVREKVSAEKTFWDWETFVGGYNGMENPILISRYRQLLDVGGPEFADE